MINNNTHIPAGYKSSELGVIPEGWQVKRLGELVSIASGVSPSLLNLMDDGKYPYIKVEDMNNCDKYQIFSRNYSNDENYIIDANSVIFPKRGAAILNNKVRICSVAIQMDSNMMSISPKKEINVEYLYYKLTSEQLFKIADTSTIPQINNKHILPYKITLPPLEEQERIAEILGTWDRAIELQGRKVALLQNRKRALMQQLLTPHRRLPNFSEPWNTREFDDIFIVVSIKKNQIQKSFYSCSGKYPIVDQGKQLIAAYTDIECQYLEIPIIVFGDHTRILKWIDFPFVAGADGVQAINANKEYALKFCYYLLCNTEIINLGYSRHMSELKQKNFDVPSSVDEQRAIAEVLTTADREIELATQNLTALSSQKRALMQQLLTGKKQVKI